MPSSRLSLVERSTISFDWVPIMFQTAIQPKRARHIASVHFHKQHEFLWYVRTISNLLRAMFQRVQNIPTATSKFEGEDREYNLSPRADHEDVGWSCPSFHRDF